MRLQRVALASLVAVVSAGALEGDEPVARERAPVPTFAEPYRPREGSVRPIRVLVSDEKIRISTTELGDDVGTGTLPIGKILIVCEACDLARGAVEARFDKVRLVRMGSLSAESAKATLTKDELRLTGPKEGFARIYTMKGRQKLDLAEAREITIHLDSWRAVLTDGKEVQLPRPAEKK